MCSILQVVIFFKYQSGALPLYRSVVLMQ